MMLDLGGIGKGYAVDAAMAVLAKHGIDRALVAVAGEIGLGAPPPGKNGWRVGIAGLADNGPPTQYLSLVHTAISTSGDTRQFVEIGGRRYSHIVDPKTGVGLTDHSIVTVIAPDNMTADALASAVSVLGPKAGLELIDATPGTAAWCRDSRRGSSKPTSLGGGRSWPTPRSEMATITDLPSTPRRIRSPRPGSRSCPT